jgi:hypothetical protein
MTMPDSHIAHGRQSTFLLGRMTGRFRVSFMSSSVTLEKLVLKDAASGNF